MASMQQLKELGPFLVLTGVLTLGAAVVLMKFGGASHMTAPAVVSFDVIKYTNSQKAVASAFLKRSADAGESSSLLQNLPQRTRESIQKIAGEGTLVIIKQAVVQGQMDDITDAVLTDLGMPVGVPTADGTAHVLSASPTALSLILGAPQLDPAPAPTGTKAELP